MKKVRKNYSLEFKIQAVSLSEQRGNVSSVAQELGICKESLVNWRKLHKEGKLTKEKQIIKNPFVKVKDNNWVFGKNGADKMITHYESVSTVDGLLYNEYMGRSALLDLEIFKEYDDESLETYYTFYNVESPEEFELYTIGYPQIRPGEKLISYIVSNNDVGSDFLISKYVPRKIQQQNLLYVNFTNFKISDENKCFWGDNETFYAEVFPLNSVLSKGKKQKKAFIKISLKTDLF